MSFMLMLLLQLWHELVGYSILDDILISIEYNLGPLLLIWSIIMLVRANNEWLVCIGLLGGWPRPVLLWYVLRQQFILPIISVVDGIGLTVMVVYAVSVLRLHLMILLTIPISIMVICIDVLAVLLAVLLAAMFVDVVLLLWLCACDCLVLVLLYGGCAVVVYDVQPCVFGMLFVCLSIMLSTLILLQPLLLLVLVLLVAMGVLHEIGYLFLLLLLECEYPHC